MTPPDPALRAGLVYRRREARTPAAAARRPAARRPTRAIQVDRQTTAPRRAAPLGWVAIGSVLLLTLALAFRTITETDLGFHLRAGEWILANGRVPWTDTFTYTVAGHTYIDIQWLWQVGAALLYRAGGAFALVAVYALLIAGVFATVAFGVASGLRSPLALAVPMLLGVLASELRFTPRPEVVSWLLLCLVLWIVRRRGEDRPAPLWALPVIQGLWVNVEGLFVLGWVVVACGLIGTALERRRFDRALAGWGAAGVLASFLNPYTLQGVLFPLTLLTRLYQGNPFGESISEFASPWNLELYSATAFYPRLAVWAYFGLVALTAAASAVTWRRRRAIEWLLLLIFFGLSVQAIRNVPLFVLVAIPAAGAALADLPAMLAGAPRGRAPAPSRAPVAGGAAAALIMVVAVALVLRVVSNAYYIDDRRDKRFGYGISSSALPVGAADFMRDRGITGRIFNHLSYGGFLMWQLGEPVFIDGRLEVMGEAFYQQYQSASSGGLMALLKQYDAQVAVFPYVTARSWLEPLRQAPDWRLVYYDELSAIFLRGDTSPEIAAVQPPDVTPRGTIVPVPEGVRSEALFAPRFAGYPAWLEGFWRGQTYPTAEYREGVLWYYLDRPEAAEAYLIDALRASQGRYYEVYNALGGTYVRAQRYQEAAFCYRTVLAEQPGNRLAQQGLQQLGQR